jgi:hypothetical protein
MKFKSTISSSIGYVFLLGLIDAFHTRVSRSFSVFPKNDRALRWQPSRGLNSDESDIDQANWEEGFMKTRVRNEFLQIDNVDSTKLIDEIRTKGVGRLNSVLTAYQIDSLREFVLSELSASSTAVNEANADPNLLFGNVKMTQNTRWDLKLPFASPVITDVLHSLLQADTVLCNTLNGLLGTNGGGGDFYELNAFVTSSGAKRQVIHSDTFWESSASLFTITIALQVFLGYLHSRSRRDWTPRK